MAFYHTPDTLCPYHMVAYKPGQQAYGVGICALDGDYAAQSLLADHLTEFGEAPMQLFATGNKLLIQTVTLYYVGEVTEVDGMFVVLKDASWVHWTGEFGVLMRQLRFTGFDNQESRARTEFVGGDDFQPGLAPEGVLVGVNKASMVAVYKAPWMLPTESLV